MSTVTKLPKKQKTTNYNSFPDKDFPPTPWCWLNNNGFNSSTYIFCGEEPVMGMDFIEIPDDSDFMSIDADKLAKFIVEAGNRYHTYRTALIQAKAWFEHFKADKAASLMPTDTALDTAIAEIDAVLA